MPKSKSQYEILSPVTPKGKWSICSRRIGTKDRLAIVAETRSEALAGTIVDGLNLLQGETLKLEVPAQRTLEEVRETLVKERATADLLRRDVRDRDNKLSETQRTLGNTRTDLARVERERDNLQRRVDDLMKAVPDKVNA